MSDWSRLTVSQLNVIMALDFAVPLHSTHVRQRYKARSNTLESLEKMGLIRLMYLEEEHKIAGMPFYTLTQQGQTYQRDYKNWIKKTSDIVCNKDVNDE